MSLAGMKSRVSGSLHEDLPCFSRREKVVCGDVEGRGIHAFLPGVGRDALLGPITDCKRSRMARYSLSSS